MDVKANPEGCRVTDKGQRIFPEGQGGRGEGPLLRQLRPQFPHSLGQDPGGGPSGQASSTCP